MTGTIQSVSGKAYRKKEEEKNMFLADLIGFFGTLTGVTVVGTVVYGGAVYVYDSVKKMFFKQK